MTELPRQSNASARLEAAEPYAALLDSERLAERDTADPELYSLRASQGAALRRLLYHCTAAIVAAIREARDG
jgi:hypothetical protein